MIDVEYSNDNTLIRHFSTLGVKLRQVETGELYDDPIDDINCPYTYEETAIPVKEDETILNKEEVID